MLEFYYLYQIIRPFLMAEKSAILVVHIDTLPLIPKLKMIETNQIQLSRVPDFR